MGTLTANDTRLPDYCDHKLPTSCRLSSIPQCCACADERAHAASYSVYIDGVGFVPRGNRWQRYCWFCKEFWDRRVQAAGLSPSQTRIPEVPDQTEFLERWYDFHRGYRVITGQDGTEERVTVLGEDLRGVSPGCLPRTVEELRAGRLTSELTDQEARRGEHNRQESDMASPAGPDIETTLDSLLMDVEWEDVVEESPTSSPVPEAPAESSSANEHSNNAQYVHRATISTHEDVSWIENIRRELEFVRSGIQRVSAQFRELGPDTLSDTQATNGLLNQLTLRLNEVSRISARGLTSQASEHIGVSADSVEHGGPRTDNTVPDMQARIHEARTSVNRAREIRDRAASELEHADQQFRSAETHLRQLHTERRTAENYVRIFGTREEIVQQGENYESPIGGMFTRAWERFQAAEDVRREERTLRQVLNDENMVVDGDASNLRQRLSDIESSEPDIWGIPQLAPRGGSGDASEEQHIVPVEEDPLDSAVRLLRQNADRFAAEADVLTPWPESMLAALSPSTILAGPPGQQLDADPSQNNDRAFDAYLMLGCLSEDANIRAHIGHSISPEETERIRQSLLTCTLNMTDRDLVETLLENETLVWACRLPSIRNTRRRNRGELVTFTPDAYDLARDGQVIIHDVEMMSETFLMSGRVRGRSGLMPTDRANMHSRLSDGQRTAEDREVLFRMLQDQSTLASAEDAQEQIWGGGNEELRAQLRTLEEFRRQAARRGDHSRTELDAQRRETSALALAAGRTAMRTGPSALLEQMTNLENQSQRLRESAWERIRFQESELRSRLSTRPRTMLSDVFSNSTLRTEPDPNEAIDEERGLDAKDSGRPDEPMTDEDMTVKLDCRICYSQVADIACLPCGHLVMCKWCSDQHSPVMANDRTRPRRPTGCPVCRKNIRQKVKVFRP